MSVVISIYHAAQACASAFTGLYSAMAIYNLQQNEGHAETASQYSDTAAQQLHKTRTTQTSGALATVSSLISSIILAIGVSSKESKIPLLLSMANSVGLMLAYRHIRNFWRNRPKVPLFSDYNDGVNASKQLLQLLGILSVTWALVTVLYLWQALAK